MRVIKISGHDLDRDGFVARFALAVAAIAAGEPVVLVNGGGRSISALQQAFGLAETKVAGLRVTDARSLEITEMVMSGQVNKLVVRALLAAGLDAVGLSGVDGRLLTARRKRLSGGDAPAADLGFVGEIVGVRVDLLTRLVELGLTPVLSPVSCDPAGQHYNVNADEAATAVAAALTADQLDFVSNVPGVLRDLTAAEVIPHLTAEEARTLMVDGTIRGGMIPKVQSALEAIARGVPQVRIVDLPGLPAGGTRFTPTG